MTPTGLSTAPVSPALIAAAFDRLAWVPAGSPLHPHLLITMARGTGCDDREIASLLVRIRATALVFNDPRWLPWVVVFRSCDADVRRSFDDGLLAVIAGLPLNAALRFDANRFFGALLAMARPAGSRC